MKSFLWFLVNTAAKILQTPVYHLQDDGELCHVLSSCLLSCFRNIRNTRQHNRKHHHEQQLREMSLPNSSAPAAPSEDSLSNDANQDDDDRKKADNESSKKEEKPSEDKKNSDDMDIMDNTECKFNVNSFKMVYVVKSESYLYKRLALRRAKEVFGLIHF